MQASIYVRKGFTAPILHIKEDGNVAEFSSVAALEASLIHRARCVLGLRKIRDWETTPINGRALQHAVRMIAEGHQGGLFVDEPIVAEYALHIASETQYWYSDPHFRLSQDTPF